MIKLLVKVKIYSDKKSELPSCPYRPHFIAQGSNEMLGVEFEHSDLIMFDSFARVVVKLFYNGVDYSQLNENARFCVVEGNTIVGEGYVLGII